MSIARPDWTVARIDDGWRKLDLDDPATYGDSPALARAIEKSMAFRRAGFLLVNVSMLDFVWDGGGEMPPSSRSKINWRSMFLVDLGKDGEAPNKATLWVHPDIAAMDIAPATLAAFIPPTSMNESELVSARQFLIMLDAGGVPTKPVTGSASNDRPRASH
jgi:hypothetical protein